LTHIIRIDSNSSNKNLWLLYLFIPLGYFLVFWISKKLKSINKVLLIVISVLFLFVGLVILKNWKKNGKELSNFENQYAFYLGNNKINYFISSCIIAYNEEKIITNKQLKSAISSYQESFRNRSFLSRKYPLLHTIESENVLGPYFPKSKTKPNIVFIISEGLSGGFSGMHPSSKSLTPFIDSLAKKGLYWSNFLSNCNRTFGVFPNVFASLTNGTLERGFMNFDGTELYTKRYPDHNSLLQELKKNGYTNSFTYGGWGDFDNYKNFMKAQNIDYFYDQTNFDSTKYLAPWKRKPTGFYWGYDDHSLINQSFDNLKKIKSPYVNILLTLNMHDPYNLIPTRFTAKKYIQQRLKALHLDKSMYAEQDPAIIGSIFSYEDAVKQLIYRYKKRKDFKNTIFILFGDHYSFVSFLNNPLDVYHVPFIIYSPLLKRVKQFPAVSTHLDITPSLQILLRDNFNISISSKNHYIGNGLDTTSHFKCDKIQPFNCYNKNNYPYYLYKNYIVCEDGIYQIKQHLRVQKITNQTLIRHIKKHVSDYKIIDRYVCKKNKLW
jgi:uncharacterized sulfatase